MRRAIGALTVLVTTGVGLMAPSLPVSADPPPQCLDELQQIQDAYVDYTIEFGPPSDLMTLRWQQLISFDPTVNWTFTPGPPGTLDGIGACDGVSGPIGDQGPGGNTRYGSKVWVDLGDAQVQFGLVTASGDTSVTPAPPGPAIPAGYSLVDLSGHRTITTTATVQYSVVICLPFGGTSYADAANVRLLWLDAGAGAWVDVTTDRRLTGQMVCGVAPALSDVVAAEGPASPAEPTGTTRLASVATDGTLGNGHSSETINDARISGDGRWAVFGSKATNLAPGPASGSSIYRRDLVTGETVRISGSADGYAFNPAVSDDGNSVAFSAVVGPQVFVSVRDVAAGTTRLIGSGGEPDISADGRWVVFHNESDLYVNDRDPDGNGVFDESGPSVRHLGAGQYAAMSPNGRFVAFARNFDAHVLDRDPDGNGVYDEQPAVVTLVNATADGTPGLSSSGRGDVADDGDVAFWTYAPNLGAVQADVFVRDYATGALELIGRSISNIPRISADGRYVAFDSFWTNGSTHDTNGWIDVFRRDRVAGTTVVASRTEAGLQPAFSYVLGMSADGGHVVWGTNDGAVDADTNGLIDVYVRSFDAPPPPLPNTPAGTGVAVSPVDETTGTPSGVTITFDEVTVAGDTTVTSTAGPPLPNGYQVAGMSFDIDTTATFTGQVRVCFDYSGLTVDENLLQLFHYDDGAAAWEDITILPVDTVDDVICGMSDGLSPFVLAQFDPDQRLLTLESVDESGAPGAGDSRMPSLSRNGRFVVFSTTAALVAVDTNGVEDVYRRDLQTGTTALVSASTAGAAGDNRSGPGGAVSENGRYVAFKSAASNLVAGDTNDAWDVFRKDMATGAVMRVSVTSSGQQSHDLSAGSINLGTPPAITPDGNVVAFSSSANDLGAASDFYPDVFVHTVSTGVTEVASYGGTPTPASGGSSYGPSLSDDGRQVAFYSAKNFVAADTSEWPDVYVRHLDSGDIALISVSSSGQQGVQRFSQHPSISADGRFVAFASGANNFVVPDNENMDVYVRDRDTDQDGVFDEPDGVSTERINPLAPGFKHSYYPTMTPDGAAVAYLSQARLVAEDTDDHVDVYLTNRGSGETVRVSAPVDGSAPNGSAGSFDISFDQPQDRVAITPDTKLVAFSSFASNLVDDDPDACTWVDWDTGTTTPRNCRDVFLLTSGTLGGTGADDVPAGGTVSTGTNVGAEDPFAVSVTTPVEGPVMLTELPVAPAAPDGYTVLGQYYVDIEAPAASTAQPLVLRFMVDQTVWFGVPPSQLTVLRNGVPVGDCADYPAPSASGEAAPDPCVAQRNLTAGFDLELVVRTSQASRWLVVLGTNAPVSVDLEAPTTPIVAGTTGGVIAHLTDDDVDDQHTCTFSWSGTAAGSSDGIATDGRCVLDTSTFAAGQYDVGVDVTDLRGASASASGSFTVVPPNHTPSVELVPPDGPVRLGTTNVVRAVITDADVGDTHECTFTLGATSSAPVPASGGQCELGTSTLPVGVHEIVVTVDDAAGATATSASVLLVIYDPKGGFVTGGGWINSPAGSFAADPALSGKATFGFVSKYAKGATVPTGDTEFQFKAGALSFSSTTYEWLVVSGSKARFKGEGTVDGAAGYRFMITAADGNPDGFRIRIWNDDGVVYDNHMGSAELADDVTVLGGGSIIVHKA